MFKHELGTMLGIRYQEEKLPPLKAYKMTHCLHTACLRSLVHFYVEKIGQDFLDILSYIYIKAMLLRSRLYLHVCPLLTAETPYSLKIKMLKDNNI